MMREGIYGLRLQPPSPPQSSPSLVGNQRCHVTTRPPQSPCSTPRFYPSDCLTLPYTIVDSGISISHVIAAPLAAACLSLTGLGGMRGWQWLFLLEGTPTLILAAVMFAMLPNSLEQGEKRGPEDGV